MRIRFNKTFKKIMSIPAALGDWLRTEPAVKTSFGGMRVRARSPRARRKLNLRRLAVLCIAALLVIAIPVVAVLASGGAQDTGALVSPSPSIDLALLPTPSPTPEPTPTPLAALEPGIHSPEVTKLQERLMDLDFLDPDEPTDYYGPATDYAIQLFQRKHGLQIDGIAGVETLQMIYQPDAKHYTVSLDTRGSDVQGFQQRLKELGYLKGKVTGFFGTDTAKAVKAFQKRNGLTVDGNVGENTREVLYSEDAKHAAVASKPTVKKPSGPTATADPDPSKVEALIAFALTQQGKPYVRGGKGPDSFDCSGFVYYCLKSIGMNIHYMTSAGWAVSSWPRVAKADLKRGDILCFRGHVGIYMGNNQMIDASSSQGKIRVVTTSSKYWNKYFRCGKRVF
jgi:peptidoglycan DL-endopeptidase CwlO